MTSAVHIRLVFDQLEVPFDAIGAYTQRLAQALGDLPGVEVSSGSRAGTRPVTRSDITLLQYNPFSYGRGGLAPGVPLWILVRRLSKSTRRVVVMVHEPFVAPHSTRTFLIAIAHRIQLAAIKALADLVLAPTADAARRTQGLGRVRPRVVPVGSNLPDLRKEREAVRAELGIAASEPVLAVLGRSRASLKTEHLVAAIQSVSALGPCHLFLLGADMMLPDLPDTLAVHRPGALAESDLARMLAGADMFLAPYLDGVSTRRTSLVAALQHGLPIIGTTVGRSDGILLSDAGLVVIPEQQVDEFAETASRLAADPQERRKRSEAARALYDRCFAWPVIAREVHAAVVSVL